MIAEQAPELFEDLDNGPVSLTKKDDGKVPIYSWKDSRFKMVDLPRPRNGNGQGIVVGSFSPDDTPSTLDVTQPNTFNVGDIIYNDSGVWRLARADSEDTLGTFPVLSAIPTGFEIPAVPGNRTVEAHGYPVGHTLYLSDTVAGKVGADDTGSGIGAPYGVIIGTVIDADTIYYDLDNTAYKSMSVKRFETIVQANTFSVGDIVTVNSGSWVLAQADAQANLGPFPVMSATASSFEIPKFAGAYTFTAHPYGADGQHFYLSDVTAGDTVTVAPTISLVLGQVIDVNTVAFTLSQEAFV